MLLVAGILPAPCDAVPCSKSRNNCRDCVTGDEYGVATGNFPAPPTPPTRDSRFSTPPPSPRFSDIDLEQWGNIGCEWNNDGNNEYCSKRDTFGESIREARGKVRPKYVYQCPPEGGFTTEPIYFYIIPPAALVVWTALVLYCACKRDGAAAATKGVDLSTMNEMQGECSECKDPLHHVGETCTVQKLNTHNSCTCITRCRRGGPSENHCGRTCGKRWTTSSGSGKNRRTHHHHCRCSSCSCYRCVKEIDCGCRMCECPPCIETVHQNSVDTKISKGKCVVFTWGLGVLIWAAVTGRNWFISVGATYLVVGLFCCRKKGYCGKPQNYRSYSSTSNIHLGWKQFVEKEQVLAHYQAASHIVAGVVTMVAPTAMPQGVMRCGMCSDVCQTGGAPPGTQVACPSCGAVMQVPGASPAVANIVAPAPVAPTLPGYANTDDLPAYEAAVGVSDGPPAYG